MNAENFAEWFKRQKYHVFRTPSSYWVDTGADVLQSFPYHWIIQPTKEELMGLFRKTRSIALRYSTPVQTSQGRISYHVVYEEKGYSLASMNRQSRQNVCRGLEYAHVERISLQKLADEGWPMRQETLQRQCRQGAEHERWWRNLCLSAQGLPGIEAWGAIHDGRLVASFLAFRCDDTYLFIYEQSFTEHLKYRVNNVLYFEAIRQALQQEGVNRAFFGLNSLDAPASIDEFKFRMGLKPKLVRQSVVFNPWIQPLANSTVHRIITTALRHYPQNYFLAKAEGMLRFHIQGKLPIQEQEWPECICGMKAYC